MVIEFYFSTLHTVSRSWFLIPFENDFIAVRSAGFMLSAKPAISLTRRHPIPRHNHIPSFSSLPVSHDFSLLFMALLKQFFSAYGLQLSKSSLVDHDYCQAFS